MEEEKVSETDERTRVPWTWTIRGRVEKGLVTQGTQVSDTGISQNPRRRGNGVPPQIFSYHGRYIPRDSGRDWVWNWVWTQPTRTPPVVQLGRGGRQVYVPSESYSHGPDLPIPVLLL